MPFDVDMSKAQPLLDRVRNVFSPSVANDILLYAGQRVGVKAEELVSAYPPISGKALPLFYTRQRADGSTYKSKFKSLKQQRKVMAMASKGLFPYRRTGSLGKSITSRPSLAGNGLVIVSVGSNLPYAPYVLDRILQSHYHMGNWTPIQTDIENGLPALAQTAVNAITRKVNEVLNG